MYKIMGITDEVTACDCCGKTNLKRTVVLDNGSGIVHFGVDCAAKAMSRKSNVIREQADAMRIANNWLAKGYDAKTVASGVWNKLGFQAYVKNNRIIIQGVGEIEL